MYSSKHTCFFPCSVLSVLLLVFYVYAIIGMEVFPHNTVYPGCWWVTSLLTLKPQNSYFYSENASYGVGTYYSSSSTENGTNANVYWLNNFDDLWRSYG